jgi:hypothetical protein
MSQTQLLCPRRSAPRPRSSRRPPVDGLLREMAFVLHLTRRVRQMMTAERSPGAAAPLPACAGLSR